MQIFSLHLFIPAHEAQAHVKKALAQISALQDAEAELTDNGVITRGKVNLGLALPFEALWQVTASATEIIVTLSHLKASMFGMGGDAMAEGLMKLLAKKLESIAGVRIAGRAIHAETAALLKQQFNIELRGVLREVKISREGILIRVEPS